MHSASVRLASLFVVLASSLACSSEKLSTERAVLRITPLPEGIQTALDAPVGLDLGQVPLYGVATARFELRNLGTRVLEIDSATIESATGCSVTVAEFPKTLGAAAKGELVLSFSPEADGVTGEAIVALATNAGDRANETARVQLRGLGLFVGEPELEVCYGGECRPKPTECAPNGAGLAECALAPVEFGNVPFDTIATLEVRLRNVPLAGTCLAPPGSPACTKVCQLVVDKNPDASNVGVGFDPADAGFGVGGNLPIPFAIDVQDPDCGASGEVRLLITFAAGAVERDVNAILTLETNDPSARLVRIPLQASVREAPVAVAKVRECGASDPLPDCSDPAAIRPLERVHFHGRDSFDARGEAIVAYEWQVVETPSGVNPDDFQWVGGDTEHFSMWLPLAGTYRVRLKVTNALGIESGVSDTSDVEVQAIPASRMYVALTWDHPSNDQDLHVTLASDGHRVCKAEDDCFWRNCRTSCLTDGDCSPAIWFGGAPFQGPNPRLDLDDTSGLGPENTNIDQPAPGRYRIYVHYYALVNPEVAATSDTVRIFIDGEMRGEYRRRLNRNELWRVADIVWNADGSTQIELLPSDGGGIGSVRTMNACPAEGFDFGPLN